jgi:ferric-dicitrate binding protein FerR (iron transport regulator)
MAQQPKEAFEVRPIRPALTPARPTSVSRWSSGWRLVARNVAAALLVAAVAIPAWNHAVNSRQTARHNSPQMREVATARGQRARVRLDDGTQVTLAPASLLRFAAQDDGGARDVYLFGEAFFEVKHDTSRPFRVHTSHGITEDIGTTFNIQAYAGDTLEQVTVSEGSVALHVTAATRKPAVLTAGQLARLTAGGRTTVVSGTNIEQYFAWTQGRLLFKNTPLREVLHQLSRWYDVDCGLSEDALGDRLLTASFSGEPTAEVLDFIALSLGVRYERHGRVVTFYPKVKPH